MDSNTEVAIAGSADLVGMAVYTIKGDYVKCLLLLILWHCFFQNVIRDFAGSFSQGKLKS